jgi:hypothetical protein
VFGPNYADKSTNGHEEPDDLRGVLAWKCFSPIPIVPIDTNHLERALRVLPTGRKTGISVGPNSAPKHVGIIQSLIVTCRLYGVDPYTYLVDVLQRIGRGAPGWLRYSAAAGPRDT